MGGHDMAKALTPIEQRQRALIDHRLGLGGRIHHSGADPRDIPAQPEHPVGGVAPQLGLDKAAGDQPGVGGGNALGLEDGRGEAGQPFGERARHLASLILARSGSA